MPNEQKWYAVFDKLTGELFSTGTVLPDHTDDPGEVMPDHLQAVEIDGPPDPDKTWDAESKAFVSRPVSEPSAEEQATAALIAEAQATLLNDTANRRERMDAASFLASLGLVTVPTT